MTARGPCAIRMESKLQTWLVHIRTSVRQLRSHSDASIQCGLKQIRIIHRLRVPSKTAQCSGACCIRPFFRSTAFDLSFFLYSLSSILLILNILHSNSFVIRLFCLRTSSRSSLSVLPAMAPKYRDGDAVVTVGCPSMVSLHSLHLLITDTG